MSQSDDTTTSPEEERQGDPLEGLWHWTDHPLARAGFVIAILLGSLILFPLLAQITF